MDDFYIKRHRDNLLRSLIPAETDTGALVRLMETRKQDREHAEALEAQKIRVENTAEAEIKKVIALLEGMGKPHSGRK